jgi:glycosyltransferase involved in cell wall biosynthesis
MNTPKVSVVIRAYNAVKFIEQAINSIVEQIILVL